VTFQRLGAESCRIQVRIEPESHSVMERIGSALGADSAEVKRSLEQFKGIVERGHVSRARQRRRRLRRLSGSPL
jgi:hypothetical protein